MSKNRFGATDESTFETGAEKDCKQLSSLLLFLQMIDAT